MTINIRWFILPITLIMIANLDWYHSLAQVSDVDIDDSRYFPQTGHWVMGKFLETYQGTPHSIDIFGYPITEAYQEQTRGRIVQYFEKARFEIIQEWNPELRVKVSPLGELLYTPGPILPLPENFPACQVFPETGFQVCYSFLDHFNNLGGAGQFGYPISNFEIHDELIVQYFQRARFEWHPELPKGKRVKITDLGRIYYKIIGEDTRRLHPIPHSGNNLPQIVLNLKVHAFPENAVLPRNGSQTFFIIVQDQNDLPVPNAAVTLMVKLPSGHEDQIIIPGVTDKNGVIVHRYTYSDQSPGVTEVFVDANYDTLHQQTVTSFRIWW